MAGNVMAGLKHKQVTGKRLAGLGGSADGHDEHYRAVNTFDVALSDGLIFSLALVCTTTCEAIHRRTGLSPWRRFHAAFTNPRHGQCLIAITSDKRRHAALCKSEQVPRRVPVVDGHVQVGRGDTDVGVASSVAGFGQCFATSQGVADVRAAVVVDR